MLCACERLYTPNAFSDERSAQQEPAKSQTPKNSAPSGRELKQLKQQLNRHERTFERHNKILEERERKARQHGLVLHGLEELVVQPAKKDEEDF